MQTGTYLDEKIIRLQGFYNGKTALYDFLKEEILICGRKVRFIPRNLFDNKICIWIPHDFIEMPEIIAKVRYISNYRPPVILTNAGYDENFGFHLLDKKEIENYGEIDGLIEQMKNAVLFQAPETVIYDKGIICSTKANARWFEYKNFTLDDETYNLQFLFDFSTCVLAGTFNCRMRYYDKWKKPVLAALEYTELFERREYYDESR